MNRTRRFVQQLAYSVMALALIISIISLLPVRTWAQQIVRATIISAIPAGSNDIGNVNIKVAGTNVAVGGGTTGAGSFRTVTATDSPEALGIGGTGDAAVVAGATGSLNAKMRLLTTDMKRAADALELSNSQDPIHGNADTGAPVKIGGRSLSFGTNPTGTANNARTDAYFTRAGQLFTISGHPNIITREAQIEDADGAQVDAAIVTVSSAAKVVVTMASANCDASTTNPTNIVIGFGVTTLPSRTHIGTNGIIAAFDGVPPGGGKVKGNGAGIIAVGAADEDVRISTEDPVGGACSVELTYYTIEG